jgi:hypothetical protein
MRPRAQERGVGFLVWSCPTKFQCFLRGMCIDFVDATPALREHLERGAEPYHESDDGHPNALGHRIIAEVLLSHLPRTWLSQPSNTTISQPGPVPSPPSSSP